MAFRWCNFSCLLVISCCLLLITYLLLHHISYGVNFMLLSTNHPSFTVSHTYHNNTKMGAVVVLTKSRKRLTSRCAKAWEITMRTMVLITWEPAITCTVMACTLWNVCLFIIPLRALASFVLLLPSRFISLLSTNLKITTPNLCLCILCCISYE